MERTDSASTESSTSTSMSTASTVSGTSTSTEMSTGSTGTSFTSITEIIPSLKQGLVSASILDRPELVRAFSTAPSGSARGMIDVSVRGLHKFAVADTFLGRPQVDFVEDVHRVERTTRPSK